MKTSWVVIAVLAVGATFSAMSSSDAELTDRIVGYLRPRCGGNHIRDEREPELIEVLDIQGDTNRLARLLAELAHTNDNWNASMALWQLEKYGTSEQLPFLYSCATNPAVGDRAVKAVLRIEGITSNSVSTLQSYLSATNHVTRELAYNRALSCKCFLSELQNTSVLPEERERTLQVVRSFAANVNTSNSIVDDALVAADSTYRYSKRRLAVMRAAYPRCFNEYQTNYVENVILELVAYPEANLPD